MCWQLINRGLYFEINNIISGEPKVVIEGATEVPACLFTLAYNLQCRAKSSEWLVRQLQDDECAVIQVLPTIKPLQVLIQVSYCINSFYCLDATENNIL